MMNEENQDNIVVEYLRRMRTQLDEIQDTQAEHGRRLTGTDHQLADMRRGMGHDEARIAEQSERIDRVNRRLELRDDA